MAAFHLSPFLGITTIEPTILSPTGADLSKLDADAVRATQRLISRGFEAYLVGGCVRDLLLDRTPKDYDIATEARPPQCKRTFPRNCRIIGRRFKLAHLHFNNNTKILECSTFRRSPQAENGDADLLITRDNEFGTAEEDALRRDFTVNALFLDPTRDLIIDYTNGLADLRARVIRTIGDPRVRFREDPVRILRAAKFAGRLGFSIEPETFAAMAETSGDLVRSAPPRLLEEILRLLRGGHSLDSFQLLRDVGALKSLVPVLAEFLGKARHDQRVAFWRLLEALDHRVQNTGRVPQNAVLLGVLLVCPVLAKAEANPGRSPSSIAEELLGPLSTSLRLPRRDAGCLKRICGVQHRFTQTDNAKRFRIAGFVQGPYFEEALELFALRMSAGSGEEADVERWYEIADRMGRHAAVDTEYHDRDENDEESEADDGGSGIDDSSMAEDAPAPQDDEDAAQAPVTTEGEPDAAAADAGEDGAGGEPRRRRRRRRRGRGRGGEDRAETAAQPEAESADESPAAEAADAAPPDRLRRQARTDFVHPEGAEDAGDERSAEAEPDAGPDAADPSVGEENPSEPGRRRRRRRRRRRGNRHGEAGEERFPASDAPAPHGEGTDAESAHHPPLVDDEVSLDPDAPASQGHDEPTDEPLAVDDAGESADGGEDTAAPIAEAGEERRGRRRRRRGRRGRGRDGHPAEGRGPEGAEGQPDSRPRDGQPQARQQQGHQQQGGNRPQREPSSPSQREGRHKDRRDSRERRRGGRGGGSGHGAPRDVDVVPRYRDRRGKVDVIEPAALDLTAFDVELDPKRVPTFGSIVEGKSRPKKRAPRVPEDGVDDYRPPPPPGSGPGPTTPPPPPPDDTPDTFGDW